MVAFCERMLACAGITYARGHATRRTGTLGLRAAAVVSSLIFFFLFVVLSSVVCALYKVMQTRRLADSLCKKDGDVRRDFEYPAVSFCACPPSWVGAYYKVDRSSSKRNLPRNSSMSVLFFIQRDVFFVDWESNLWHYMFFLGRGSS